MPNFSEGRDQEVIQSITDAISRVSGVRLLHVDSSTDANRTVATFVGQPGSVGEAAFQAISRAAELIDMRRHQGAHPRLGTTDVCPFVPLAGVSVEKCIRLARRVGKRVGRELAIPVYFYGAAADPDRCRLADIRRGEYEGLSQKLTTPKWKPDCGPTEFKPRTGATIIGSRNLLIAFNVNLNTTNQARASEIALAVRERGQAKRDADGRIVRDSRGRAVRQLGALRATRAMGWFIPEYNCAQVSLNLEDYRLTPPHAALEEVRRQARLRGLEVTGSELVGMVPLEAMLMAGRYYIEEAGSSLSEIGIADTNVASPASPTGSYPEEELVATAIRSMGMSKIRQFKPEESIIEYRLRQEGSPWAESVDRLAACHEEPTTAGEVVSDSY
ncbi:MAG: glutamate formimidoyltransferase [Fidelibacterota bacterium]|nr:MAG: glutamate formimidoyltransferase [Candidatus Neomarinimicrobiota bacterium]